MAKRSAISNLPCRDFPVGHIFGRSCHHSITISSTRPLIRSWFHIEIWSRPFLALFPSTQLAPLSWIPPDPPGSNSSSSSDMSSEFTGKHYSDGLLYTGWHARKQTLYARIAFESRVYASRAWFPGGWAPGVRRVVLWRECDGKIRNAEEETPPRCVCVNGGGLKWSAERHWIAPGVTAPTNPN